MTELKPCPFCGAEKRLTPAPASGQQVSIFCAACAAMGPAAWGHQDNISAAIAAWNRRAPVAGGDGGTGSKGTATAVEPKSSNDLRKAARLSREDGEGEGIVCR